MVSRVGIIGSGNVGSAVALALILRGSISELVLVDKNYNKARAEQYDLIDQQALLTTGTKVLLQKYDDENWNLIKDCDILVFAAGDIRILQNELKTTQPDRLNELRFTAKVVQEVAPKITASGFHGILINITNPCDVIVTYLQELTGIPKQRIFGSGTALDTTRMKHAVSDYFDCSIHDIDGYVLGEHGETQFTAWSTVRVGGKPMFDLVKKQDIDLRMLEKQSNSGAWYIISGKGFTSHGIGLTGATLVEAVLNDARQIFPLSAYDDQYQTYIGQIARVGMDGIITTESLELTEAENRAFAHSAKVLRENYLKIPELITV